MAIECLSCFRVFGDCPPLSAQVFQGRVPWIASPVTDHAVCAPVNEDAELVVDDQFRVIPVGGVVNLVNRQGSALLRDSRIIRGKPPVVDTIEVRIAPPHVVCHAENDVWTLRNQRNRQQHASDNGKGNLFHLNTWFPPVPDAHTPCSYRSAACWRHGHVRVVVSSPLSKTHRPLTCS